MTTEQQDNNMRTEIAEIGSVPPPPSPLEKAKRRVLEVVTRGTGDWACCNPVPGVATWWGVRRYLGGAYSRELVREAVEALLAEGKLLEAWWQDHTARKPRHWLVLPSSLTHLPGVHKLRGRPELLQQYQAGQVKAVPARLG